jgi:hypothetical protein
MNDDATRQEILYTKIWAADRDYGTKLEDVRDTVAHRIAPHVARLGYDHDINVVDFGAGDGRFLRELYRYVRMFRGIGVDVYEPTDKPSWMRWARVPMWEAVQRGDYVISTDALEHLPPDRVNDSLRQIARAAPHGFLRISLKEDRYGTERGLHLHESVFSWSEWIARLGSVGIRPTSFRVYVDQPIGVDAALEVWY